MIHKDLEPMYRQLAKIMIIDALGTSKEVLEALPYTQIHFDQPVIANALERAQMGKFHSENIFNLVSAQIPVDVAVEMAQGLSRAKVGDFAETARDLVERRLPYRERAVFHVGYFPATFNPCEDNTFAFVSVDADLYAPTAAALPLFWDRLSTGGVLLIHDVNSTQFSGAGKAVREFCRTNGILPMPICDLHGSVVLRKP